MALASAVVAQQDSVSSKKPVRADTVTGKFIPTGIRIGTDALALGISQFNKTFSGWEMNADVDFYRYYLAVDVGAWQRTYAPDSGHYENSGTYFRVGADVNFLLKDPDRNVLFFGLRYGRSVFSEDLDVIVVDPVYGNASRQYNNDNVHARWFELTGGLKVKVWNWLWMGYTGRFKFALSTSDTPEMLPHDVPGYGRTDKESYWGFNYQIFVRIPFKKLPEAAPLR